LHAQIVEAIETLHSARLDEQVERLAHHALHAELWDRALRSLRQAASKASARWAFREAARYLELALDVIARLPDRDAVVEQELDIRFDLRVALLPAARFARIAEVIEAAVALAERTGDRRRLAWAHGYLAYSALELIQQPKALESGRLALTLSEEVGDAVSALTARHYLCQIHHTRGEYLEAIEVGRPAMQASDEVVSSALAHGAIGVIPHYLMRSEAEVGQFAEALSNSETAMRRANAAGDPFGISLVCVGLGYTHVRSGLAAQAIPPLERGIDLCRTYAIDIQFPWTAATLGLAYALAGRYAEGLTTAKEAVQQSDALGIVRYQPLRISMLSNVYLLGGCREDAYATAEKALELAQRYHEKGPEAWALYLLGASGDVSGTAAMHRVRQAYLDALRQAEELCMRPLAAHCHLGLGELCSILGDAPQARQHLERALTLYREMDMHHWPPQAEAALKNFDNR
jgi:tetratricopeptide (TPR) repeat protein